jgi:hypothetical protein
MDERTPQRLGTIEMALLLGILGDALLRSVPWGINLALWTLVAMAAGWALLPGADGRRRDLSGWPLAVALFFAVCVSWRASGFLQFWNVVAVMAALSLPLLESQGIRLHLARLTDYAAGFVTAGISVGLGGILLAPGDRRRQLLSRDGAAVRAAMVGILLAVPLVFVFGGLLMSADPGFERLVRSLVDWNFEVLFEHVLLTCFIAWITAGYLATLIVDDNPVLKVGQTLARGSARRPALGIVELGIPLGALGVIFASFVAVQTQYLFGGEQVILEKAGLTYAEYARRGFFELITASTLLVPVLVGADWLLRKDNVRHVVAYRGMAGTLLVLIGLIMLSALQRMRLYTDVYGLTEDRFYATAFMGWIGIVLAMFAGTVLRGHGKRFVFGSITAGFGVVAVLNLVNPDARIASTNLARAAAGAEFDVSYVSRLSADAVPTLLSGLEDLEAEERCGLYWSAIARWEDSAEDDWRSWNLGRAGARRALRNSDLSRPGTDCQPGSGM